MKLKHLFFLLVIHPTFQCYDIVEARSKKSLHKQKQQKVSRKKYWIGGITLTGGTIALLGYLLNQQNQNNIPLRQE